MVENDHKITLCFKIKFVTKNQSWGVKNKLGEGCIFTRVNSKIHLTHDLQRSIDSQRCLK